MNRIFEKQVFQRFIFKKPKGVKKKRGDAKEIFILFWEAILLFGQLLAQILKPDKAQLSYNR
jgi:hypothetical protein